MKRIRIVMLALLCLCGCQNTLGSFEDGTLNHKELISRINREASDSLWDLMLLKENSDVNGLQRYGLNEEDVASYGIYPAVLNAVPDEIAIFEVPEEKIASVKEKVSAYIEKRSQDTSLLTSYKDMLSSYKELEIGKYYIVIIGRDADKVKQFIEEFG